ncbi:hypothetical protein GUJ93_ZPchr0005g15368 [Zizania palustris]|uniref:Secreted protein n=1 Tax=Zizania palustris TaxID=103762 RepID=A0A8J5S3L6_ZIZPA|nr:hypothetical protein GUJ93_ZPchr0005g15368 [Zizania palustris]
MACMGACTSPPKDSTVLLLLLPLPAVTAAPAGVPGGKGEVGLGLGAAVLARGCVVSPCGLLRRVERAEPNTALLGGVADLRREPAPRPLPHPTEVLAGAGGSAAAATPSARPAGRNTGAIVLSDVLGAMERSSFLLVRPAV